jgi:hypothetical protein
MFLYLIYQARPFCGLYYKPITIVNDDSSIVSKLETSLTDDAKVAIYDRHMFIVEATGPAWFIEGNFFS